MLMGLSLLTLTALAACGTPPEDGAGQASIPGSGGGASTGTGFGGLRGLGGTNSSGSGVLTAGVGGIGVVDLSSGSGTGGAGSSGANSGGAGSSGANSGGAGSSGTNSGGAGSSGANSGGGDAGGAGAGSGSGGGGALCVTNADCNDGVDCTLDTCDLETGACVSTPSDAACPGALCDPVHGAPGSGCTPVGGGCTAPDSTGQGGGGATSSGTGAGGNLSEGVPGGGSSSTCVVATCQGKVYACGDCIDDDGDGLVDMQDPMCVGPCDNTEDSFYGGIPGQNSSPCKEDCYFDQDSGSGNDACYWSQECDPLETAPLYSPGGAECAYDPAAAIAGYAGTCADAAASQSQGCHDFCGPLTPNGCDCFGCCTIPGAPTPVWLGSEDGGAGSCTLDALGDPTKCKPCTPVAACENTCEHCELCVGKSSLPPECSAPSCPAGVEACSPCGDPCPAGYSCITGCCSPNP
jgi:hypothetical protein